MSKKSTGVIVRFNRDGRGSIKSEGKDSKEYFFNKSCIKSERIVRKGQKVSFDIIVDEFGREYANNVSGLGKFYYGKIESYSKRNRCGIIKLDNKVNCPFKAKDCTGFINFEYKVNVSFQIRLNKREKINEAFDIRMTKQNDRIGYITRLSKEKGLAWIKDKEWENEYEIQFSKKITKKFSSLMVGDTVKYEPNYLRNYIKVNKVVLLGNNLVKRRTKGVIMNIKKYDNQGYTLVFIKTNETDRDVCCKYDDLNCKFNRLDGVYVDIYKNELTMKYYGKSVVKREKSEVIIKKNVHGFVRKILRYFENDEDKEKYIKDWRKIKGYALVFVETKNINYEVCCKLNTLDLKVRKNDAVYIDIYKFDLINKYYGKNIRLLDIPMSSKEKRRLKQKNSSLNDKLAASENKKNNNNNNRKKNKKSRKTASLDKIKKDERTNKNVSKNKIEDIQRQINELKNERDSMLEQFNSMNMSEMGVNSYDNSEVCSNDNISDDISSTNASQYSRNNEQ